MTKETSRAEKIDELLESVEKQVKTGKELEHSDIVNVCTNLQRVADIRRTEAESARFEAEAFLWDTQARALEKDKGLDLQYTVEHTMDEPKSETELREDFERAAAGQSPDVDPRSVIAAAVAQLKMLADEGDVTSQNGETPPGHIIVRYRDVKLVENLLKRLLEALGGETEQTPEDEPRENQDAER